MARTATPIVTDYSVETIRKFALSFALSNKSFVKAAAIQRAKLQSQINEIDSVFSEVEEEDKPATPAKAKRGRPAKAKRGRPVKAKRGRPVKAKRGRPVKAVRPVKTKKAGRPTKTKKAGRPTKTKKAGRPVIKSASGTGRRGRPTKGKTSLKDAVLAIIRNNGGRIEVNEIISHLKKMGFDVSAKTMGVMIQHSLRALAEEGLINRSERGVASITVKGSSAVAVIEPETVTESVIVTAPAEATT